MSKHESRESYSDRVKAFQVRRKKPNLVEKEMRQILAMSKVEVGEYVENYGKFS